MRTTLVFFAATLLGCQAGSEVTSASQQALNEVPSEGPGGPRPIPSPSPLEDQVPQGPTQADEPPTAHEEDNSEVIQFSPTDLATSTEGTFPTVSVPFRGLGTDEAARLSEQFDLISWPEREVIATTAHYVDDAMAGGPTHARIVLEPREPLADRWYAIRARLDRGAGVPRLRTRSRPDDYLITSSHAISRFRPGAQPIVQRIDVTSDASGHAWATIQFSEPVRFETDRLPLMVTADDRSLPCRPTIPYDPRDDSGHLAVALTCDGVLPGAHVGLGLRPDNLPVSVRSSMVGDALVHERGRPLVAADGGDGSREEFDLAVPTTPEARLVSPSASDELRVPRWYTTTARSTFGLSAEELVAAESL